MENKTAVEQFFEDLVHLGYIEYPDENLVQDRLSLALALEKQQIIDAYCDGRLSIIEKKVISSEQYYSETYKPTT